MKTLSKDKIKNISKLKQKKYRQLNGAVLVEGIRLIEQIQKYQVELEELYVLESSENLKSNFQAKDVYLVKEYQLKKLTSTQNPQPIAALIRQKQIALKDRKFLIYLDGIKEPGNLGTIIRTATAAGISGVILSPDCCEYYNPKVIRASLGSVFFLPIEIHDFEWLKKQKAKIISTIMEDAENIFEVSPITENIILVIGSEAFGISEEILKISHKKIKIPTSKNIESINASVAAGIAIFQLIKK